MNMTNILIGLLVAVALGALIGAYFYGLVGALGGGALVAVIVIGLLAYVFSKADFG